MKIWQVFDQLECPDCGDAIEVLIDKNGNAIVKNTSILNAESAWKNESKQSV